MLLLSGWEGGACLRSSYTKSTPQFFLQLLEPLNNIFLISMSAIFHNPITADHHILDRRP